MPLFLSVVIIFTRIKNKYFEYLISFLQKCLEKKCPKRVARPGRLFFLTPKKPTVHNKMAPTLISFALYKIRATGERIQVASRATREDFQDRWTLNVRTESLRQTHLLYLKRIHVYHELCRVVERSTRAIQEVQVTHKKCRNYV